MESVQGPVTKSKTLPRAPEELDFDSKFREVPFWHQKWEVFPGVVTPGRNPVTTLMDNVGLPQDMSGMRVLDIGAWNCCFSFECERRGAEEVVAMDLDDPRDLGFFVLRDMVGSKRVRFVQGSAYSLDAAILGKFDIVLFLGVLYHLRYPLLALDQIRKITAGTLYLETLVIDHRFLEGGKDFQTLEQYHPALVNVPLWQFYKSNELSGDASNWFGPNIRAVLDGLESAGFSGKLQSTWGDRAAFQAVPSGSGTFSSTYEGESEIVRKAVHL